MLIHRLLRRLFPAFCGGKALNGNVKHFVFDLTCDVTGDPGIKFLSFIWKMSSRPLHYRLNFSTTPLVSEIDGGPLRPPPPPQQRVGGGLGPAWRGLTWACHEIDLTSGHEYKKSKIYKLHELLTSSTSKSLKTLGSELWLWQGVKVAKLRFEVTSLNVTWRPDLIWPGVKMSTQDAQRMNE